jgi:hypothetical protein
MSRKHGRIIVRQFTEYTKHNSVRIMQDLLGLLCDITGTDN